MLKLLKYDWKHNSTVFYGIVAVLTIVELLFMMGLYIWNWEFEVVMAFTVMGFLAAAVTLFVQNCRLFADNLRSYSRRLLPVSPYQEIASIVMIHIIYAVTITILLSLTSLVLISYEDNSSGILFFMGVNNKGMVGLSLLYTIWNTFSTLILILFCISCAFSFRSRFRVWIGIVVFFMITISTSAISNLFYRDDVTDTMRVQGENFSIFTLLPTADMVKMIGSFSLELVGTTVLVFGIAYLMKRRIEL